MILEIGYRKISMLTADGQIMPVRELLTQQRGEIKSVKGFTEFDDLDTVQFVFRWGLFTQRIPIDSGVEKAIIAHLRLYHAKADLSFDCYAFANLVRGVPSHPIKYMRAYWETAVLTKKPKGGDVVFLVNMEDTTFYHAAIYLGVGLYLSVWGAGGDMEVATLQDMKIGFNSQKVFLATPRQP